MFDRKDYIDRIFSIKNCDGFRDLALQAFDYQREHCRVYSEYLGLVGKKNICPQSLEDIPFLPISLFKNRDILSLTSDMSCEDISLVFTSSATTGMVPSRHMVWEPEVYERSFREGFRRVYGEPGTYNLLALLPSYLERKGSSLVYMADRLINDTKQNGAEGGFFLYNHDELLSELRRIEGRKTILLGVSFALLDFAKFVAEQNPDPEERKTLFSDVTVIETGGMKGRGEELSRDELHRRLKEGFVSARIDSEYGMCELLSQAYSVGNLSEGLFFTPVWMRVLARDLQDPFRILPERKDSFVQGGLNIIDLANINSCCFIETEDMGQIFVADEKRSVHPPFTVDGRIQNSELRGCNMLID